MGGIGTGCFAINSRGQLQDFELFNRPSKGLNFPFTFFAVISAEIGIARKELDFLHDNFKRGKIPTEILAASSGTDKFSC